MSTSNNESWVRLGALITVGLLLAHAVENYGLPHWALAVGLLATGIAMSYQSDYEGYDERKARLKAEAEAEAAARLRAEAEARERQGQ